MYKILAANVTASSGLNFKESEIVPAHKFETAHIEWLIEQKMIEEYKVPAVEPVAEPVKEEPKAKK